MKIKLNFKQIINLKDIDDKDGKAKYFLNIISSWKDKGLTPSKITDKHIFQSSNEFIKDIYIEYQKDFKKVIVRFRRFACTSTRASSNEQRCSFKWQSKIYIFLLMNIKTQILLHIFMDKIIMANIITHFLQEMMTSLFMGGGR